VAPRIKEAHFPKVKMLDEFNFQEAQHLPSAKRNRCYFSAIPGRERLIWRLRWERRRAGRENECGSRPRRRWSMTFSDSFAGTPERCTDSQSSVPARRRRRMGCVATGEDSGRAERRTHFASQNVSESAKSRRPEREHLSTRCAYSPRSEVTGLTRVARCAGAQQAPTAVAMSTAHAHARLGGSIGLVRYSHPLRKRADTNVSRSPAMIPAAAIPSPCRSTRRITLHLSAPSAMRTPNSCRRQTVE